MLPFGPRCNRLSIVPGAGGMGRTKRMLPYLVSMGYATAERTPDHPVTPHLSGEPPSAFRNPRLPKHVRLQHNQNSDQRCQRNTMKEHKAENIAFVTVPTRCS